jgi:hypothetical protein
MSTLTPAIAQTKDSLLCFPKSQVIQIIQELETKDFLEQENTLLKQDTSLYISTIEYKDSIIFKQRLNELLYLKDYEDLQNVIDQKDIHIKELNKQAKKENIKNKLVIGGLGVISLGIAIGLLVYVL